MPECADVVFRADKDRSLDVFTGGNRSLIEDDLYVFCCCPGGMFSGELEGVLGQDLQSGEKIYAATKEDGFSEVP